MTVGKSYTIQGWARGDGASAYPRVANWATLLWTGTTSNTWQNFSINFVCGVTDRALFYAIASAAGYAEFDDISVKEFDDTYYDAYYDGERLITARLEDGISVYTFDDSRLSFPTYYTPLGYDEHYGIAEVQGIEVSLQGRSPATIDPYIIPNSDSKTLHADTRWDKITFDFFGSFDRIQDVKDANPQIPTEIKARLYVPRGAIIKRPASVENQDSTIGAVDWRRP